jgi:hypothetical protein
MLFFVFDILSEEYDLNWSLLIIASIPFQVPIQKHPSHCINIFALFLFPPSLPVRPSIMFVFFRRLRFVYKKLRLQRLHYALPFLVLCLYTVVGAYVFRYFELEQDEQRRARYRQNTEYAFKRVHF